MSGCRCLKLGKPPTWRLRKKWFLNGLQYNYPLCCVLRFTLDRGNSGLRRGATGPNGWVPCGIFHRKHHPDLAPCDGTECLM